MPSSGRGSLSHAANCRKHKGLDPDKIRRLAANLCSKVGVWAKCPGRDSWSNSSNQHRSNASGRPCHGLRIKVRSRAASEVRVSLHRPCAVVLAQVASKFRDFAKYTMRLPFSRTYKMSLSGRGGKGGGFAPSLDDDARAPRAPASLGGQAALLVLTTGSAVAVSGSSASSPTGSGRPSLMVSG